MCDVTWNMFQIKYMYRITVSELQHPCKICIPPFGKEKREPSPVKNPVTRERKTELFVHAKRGSRFFTLVLAYLYLQRKPLLSQELDSLIRWPLCGIHPRRPIRSSWSSAIYSARYHSNSCINFSHSVGVPTQQTSTLSTADSTCPKRYFQLRQSSSSL